MIRFSSGGAIAEEGAPGSRGRSAGRRGRSLGRRGVPVAALMLIATTGCGSESPAAPEPEPEPEPIPLPEPIPVPALGTDATLDVSTWNLLHFGSTGSGPTDEILQLARVRDVIRGTDADLWGVQEVTSATAFASLISHLPGYAGLLATDSTVTDGTEFYTPGELKVGLIFKTSVVSVTGARIILGEFDHAFAGRPPLEVRVRLSYGGAPLDAVIIVLHAKATSEVASWERRVAAAAGLKAYVDSARADDFVLIPGDWNDDVDESITSGRDTPYRDIVDAAPDWVYPTAALSAAGLTSILGYDDVIDHILASDEVMVRYEEGSAMVHRVDDFIPDYEDTTSDHLPVLVRFRPPG